MSPTAAKRIFVPMATTPWTRFKAGTKTVEVRNAGSPVAAQVRKAAPGSPVLLRLGYSGIRDLHGRLGRTWEGYFPGMPEWAVHGADVEWKRPNDHGYFDRYGVLFCFEVLGAHSGVLQEKPCPKCFLYPRAHFAGGICPEVGPGLDVPCVDCGEPMPHTAISQTERGVVCLMCQGARK